MKIKEVDGEYIKYSELNNTKGEIIEHSLRNGQTSYSMIVRDVLKYPDKFSNLLSQFPHFINEKHATGRPGKSFLFEISVIPKASFFLRKVLFENFYINFESPSFYTNCVSGTMESHRIPPHIDMVDPTNVSFGPSLVSNLGLTKESSGGTSFWSFRNKQGLLEMTREETNKYLQHMRDCFVSNEITEWENSFNSGDWNLEYVVPWGFNDLVIYSPTLFHQPYFDKESFLDRDRFSLACFYDIKSDEIEDIPDELRNSAYDVWKKFEICKILNYYF